jgi:hypothetical protein
MSRENDEPFFRREKNPGKSPDFFLIANLLARRRVLRFEFSLASYAYRHVRQLRFHALVLA